MTRKFFRFLLNAVGTALVILVSLAASLQADAGDVLEVESLGDAKAVSPAASLVSPSATTLASTPSPAKTPASNVDGGEQLALETEAVVATNKPSPTAAITPSALALETESLQASTPKVEGSKHQETAVPSPSPSPQVEAEVETETPSKVSPKKDELEQGSPASDNAKNSEGTVIIAPGFPNPEDSLQAFGIESPFDATKPKEKIIPPANEKDSEEGSGQEVELSTSQESQEEDSISVLNHSGKALDNLEGYGEIEQAGAVMADDEKKMDGTIEIEKNGRELIGKVETVYIKHEEGRKIYPGSEYTVYQDDGPVLNQHDGSQIGTLMHAAGVVKVTKVDNEQVLAKVIATYFPINPGDKVRLRDADKLNYLRSLHRGKGEIRGQLNGMLVAIGGGKEMASGGDIVYLNFGRMQGVAPGMRFTIFRQPQDDSNGAINTELGKAVGNLGVVEVLSTQKSSCTAKVVKAGNPLEVGDQVQYP